MNIMVSDQSYCLPLYFSSANEAWRYLIQSVLAKGSDETARGLAFRELIGYSTAFDMTQPLVTSVGRKLSLKYAFGEAWWILSGKDDVESLARYNAKIRNYSDDGKTFFGAYGPPIFHQLPYVVDKLAHDQSSRQATLTIWRPAPQSTKDVPCTVAIQFLIRGNKLHCIDTMRSSDAWLGWPYDVFTFSCLSTYVLLRLRELGLLSLELGTLIMQCGSQHIYAHDLLRAKTIVTRDSVKTASRLAASEFLSADEFLDWLWLRAESHLNYGTVDSKRSLTIE